MSGWVNTVYASVFFHVYHHQNIMVDIFEDEQQTVTEVSMVSLSHSHSSSSSVI